MLELHPIVEAECPYEAARGSAQVVAVEFGERHHVALWRLGLPVARQRRNPLRRRQRGAARKSPSLSSSSNRRSVIDDGHQSSVATSLTGILAGRTADPLPLEGVRARVRWQGNSGSKRTKARGQKAEGRTAAAPWRIYRQQSANG